MWQTGIGRRKYKTTTNQLEVVLFFLSLRKSLDNLSKCPEGTLRRFTGQFRNILGPSQDIPNWYREMKQQRRTYYELLQDSFGVSEVLMKMHQTGIGKCSNERGDYIEFCPRFVPRQNLPKGNRFWHTFTIVACALLFRHFCKRLSVILNKITKTWTVLVNKIVRIQRLKYC